MQNMPSGGKREGAGRKPMEPGKPRVIVKFSLSQRSKEIINDLRAKNEPVGPLIDELLLRFAEK